MTRSRLVHGKHSDGAFPVGLTSMVQKIYFHIIYSDPPRNHVNMIKVAVRMLQRKPHLKDLQLTTDGFAMLTIYKC